MKVSRQVVHADLREKTFTESLILSIKSILEQCHLELSYKKVLRTCEKAWKLWNFSASNLSWYTVIIWHLFTVTNLAKKRVTSEVFSTESSTTIQCRLVTCISVWHSLVKSAFCVRHEWVGVTMYMIGTLSLLSFFLCKLVTV